MWRNSTSWRQAARVARSFQSINSILSRLGERADGVGRSGAEWGAPRGLVHPVGRSGGRALKYAIWGANLAARQLARGLGELLRHCHWCEEFISSRRKAPDWRPLCNESFSIQSERNFYYNLEHFQAFARASRPNLRPPASSGAPRLLGRREKLAAGGHFWGLAPLDDCFLARAPRPPIWGHVHLPPPPFPPLPVPLVGVPHSNPARECNFPCEKS